MTFDEILKEKLATPVPVRGKKGKTIDPTEAMVNAVMANAMKGDIASITFIRQLTKASDPEQEAKAVEQYRRNVVDYATTLKKQLEDEHAYDGQWSEVVLLAETEMMVKKLSDMMAAPDFEPVVTDPRTGKQTVSPLIALRDSQRELFDKQLAKLRMDAVNRQIVRKRK